MKRREFLKGGLATLGFTALPGGFLFAAPKGWKPKKKPELVFGVISDTHLRLFADGRLNGHYTPDKYLFTALNYFKRQNVDAVLHCGDLANNGQIEALQYHADAWEKVFPRSLAPDGHKVERLVVAGNHDVTNDGGDKGFLANQYRDNPEEKEKHQFFRHTEKWLDIWGEPFNDFWHKEVKGFHFYGAQWDVDQVAFARFVKEDADRRGIRNKKKPVFLMSHRRMFWPFRNAVRPFYNAVLFFGHAHMSASDWNTIYMYNNATFPSIQCPPCLAPDWGMGHDDTYKKLAKAELEGKEASGKGRQGFLVRVYDDMMVIERRDFIDDGSLGVDWVMPLGKHDPHPFSKDELKKVIGDPQFGKSAKLKVQGSRLPDGEAGVRLSIPLADGNPDSRVYAYDVVVAGDVGKPKLFKSVYAAGCNLAIGHEPNKGVTKLDIHKSELPPGKTLVFAAMPRSSLGTSGKPITVEFRR